MSDQLQRDFEQWLADATRGLSDEVRAVVQDELTAHYEDAVAEYVGKGETAVSAHQLALKALGDSRETRQGLRDTHLAGRRYKTAVVAGLVLPLLMPVGLVINMPPEWGLALMAFLPLCFALYTLDFYLRQTCFFDGAKRTILFLLVGGGVSVVVSLLFPVLFDCSVFADGGCGGETAVLLTAYALLYGGIVLAGICFVNLSCTLKALKKSGNVVLTALRYLCFVNGIALIIAVPAVIFQSFGIAVLMTFILVFTLMITLGALVFLFLRAVYQEKRFEFTV